MNTTIKEYAILFLIGMLIMTTIFLDLEAWLYIIIGGALFAALMHAIIGVLYPENDLDDKIDIK